MEEKKKEENQRSSCPVYAALQIMKPGAEEIVAVKHLRAQPWIVYS